VWCAAGKGSFGTEELVYRAKLSGLTHVVAHKRLILPQLGASGVAAHLVKQLSGLRVVYGPIRASDLPAFLDGGLKATPKMRRKTFDLRERAVLIPVELVEALKYALIVLPLFFLLGGLGGPYDFWSNALNRGLFAVAVLLSGIVAGSVFTPLLLPWLPGRAFSTKGLTLGLATAAVLAVLHGGVEEGWADRLEMLGWFLLVPALTGYLAMNFTGASTYTSLSGVRKEMKWAVPLEICAGVLGLLLWMGARFVV
jgi:acetyl-CoA decarbonylase/synthase complex subunit gamma